MRLELVKDWMSREVITVSPDASLPEVSGLLTEHRIRRLPVVDNGRLLGIVTFGDVRAARPSSVNTLDVAEMNYLLAQIKVRAFMSEHPVTIEPEATIGAAAQVMLQKSISGLPVVTPAGALVGIITESDIFRMVVHDWIRQRDETSEPYTHYGT